MNLVTGATGILGSHLLLKLLLRGERVRAFRQPASDIEKVRKLFSYYGAERERLFEQIDWHQGDVRDIFSVEDALEGATRVFHAAGYVSFDRRNRKKLFAVNEQGTANVVNACLQFKLPLCHASSVATIQNLDYRTPLTEEVFWKKSGRESDYAISKYNAEREVWRGMEEGLEAVIVNPGVILSPGFWEQSSSRIFKACNEGNRFYTRGIAAYVSAEDVAEVMLRLMDSRKFGQRFIVAEGNYSFEEVLRTVHECLGKRPPGINAGKWLLSAGVAADGLASFFGRREPSLTRAIVRAALNTQLFSAEKVQAATGLKFTPVPQVIRDICKHYLADLERKQKARQN